MKLSSLIFLKHILISIAIYGPIIILVDHFFPLPMGWQVLRAAAIGGSVGYGRAIWSNYKHYRALYR